jgi:hypothetical protein
LPKEEGDMTQHELEARIAALEAKTRILEDTEAIRTLMWSYTYSLDYGDYDKVMDCFADDAKMYIQIRGPIEEGLHVGQFEGKEAIREGVFMVTPQTKDRFTASHLIENPVITVEGERAKGIFYLLTPCGYERAMWGHGRYDMVFVKMDGEWKISSFVFLWNFLTPYDEGWVKVPMADMA